MKYTNINDNKIIEEKENKSLFFLYKTFFGRLVLKLLTCKWISKIVGIFFNSIFSKFMINRYVKKYNIDLDLFEKDKYKSFNDFFTRKLKTININSTDSDFISTAESKILAYKINKSLIVNVKNSKYTIDELIKDTELANQYAGGLCIVYRLQPNNYHRYIFTDNGTQKKLKTIKGKLHTVNPISFEHYKVFSENTREVSLLYTKNFGNIIQIEVGALCVGKISNNNNITFNKYDEKGYFEFGGSTIIQLIEPNKINLNKKILNNTKNNIETLVEIGQIIGNKI